MTNFDFLYGSRQFSSFAGACAAAEKIYGIDTAACVVNVRRAAELAVKWMSFRTDTKMSEMTLQQNDPRMKAFFKIIKDHGISYLDAIEREKSARRASRWK